MKTVRFEFVAPDFVDGRWVDVTRVGSAVVIERAFQMQLGADGYRLEVVQSPNYAAGTVITVYPWSVR